MVRLSNIFSFFLKYIFPFIGLIFCLYFFYISTTEGEGTLIKWFCLLYLICLVLQTILISRLSTYVFFDRQHLTIIAYNSVKGEKKVYRLEELWRVREGVIYTVLVFKGKRKIRYFEKAPSFFEEDGESFISSLKKRAKRNRIAAKKQSAITGN